MIGFSVSKTSVAGQLPNQAGQTKAPVRQNSAPAVRTDVANRQPRLVVQTGHASGVFAAAFSPDGRFALTGGGDETARLWEVATGREIRVFEGHTETVSAVAFIGETVALTASGDNTARLWDIRTGEVIRILKGHTAEIGTAAVSPNGRFLLTGSQDGTARLWETETGREARRFSHTKPVMAVAFSPDGNTFLTGSSDGLVRRWDVTSGQILRAYPKQEGTPYSVAFSPDGRQVGVGGENRDSKTGKGFLRLWDTESGREVTKFRGHEEAVNSVRFTPDGLSLVTGSGDRTACFWDAKTGEEQRRFRPKENNPVHIAVLSPDGQTLLTGTSKETDGDVGMEGARLWDTLSGAEEYALNGDVARVYQAAFSPDEKRIQIEEVGGSDIKYAWDTDTGREFRTVPILPRAPEAEEARPTTLSPDRTLRAVESASGGAEDPNGSVILLQNARTGKVIRRLAGTGFNVLTVAFSPDGRYLLATYYHGCGRMWEAATGKRVLSFDEWGQADSAVFSPDSRAVLIGNESGEVKLWSLETGKVVRVFAGHRQHVYSVAYSPKNGRFVLTGCVDGTTRVWEAATGRELCRLVSFHNGNWVAATPDGRFDTNNLEHIEGMHWIFPDEPLTPLPLEIFLRQYYEPRLLTRILAGEPLPSVPALLSLNRVQPEVKIQALAPEADGKVTVTVRVARITHPLLREGRLSPVSSGVFDLHLFRDGQLVGYAPGSEGEVPLEKDGSARITFPHIALPQDSGKKEVVFTAYAFNTDRVKSATDRKTYTRQTAANPSRGRAYLLCMGVNAYENPAFNLHFAVNDARLFATTLPARLSTTGRYAEIIPIVLTSSDMTPQSGEGAATKANLRAVLERLAGKQPDLSAIPGAQRLQTATPDDLILICFSGHGYAAQSGAFYLLPQDIGPPEPRAQGGADTTFSPSFLARCVSSQELSLWLRDVDAGELVFIVDACQSAASIEGKNFKPGPLGSRGLGQLAYDKGMRVLAASQANDFAIESNQLQHGLLSYTLVQEGLLSPRAASSEGLTLGAWLRYGVKRVPELYEAVRKGTRLPDPTGKGMRPVESGAHRTRTVQQPALFDFRERTADIPLWRPDKSGL